MTSSQHALAQRLLLAAFILCGAVYAALTPLFEISDEVWHYPMVKTLADGNGLPVQDPAQPGPWRQEGSQPPLYYGLMALATFWIDTGDLGQMLWINPHADNGIITEDGNNNILVHTYRERWPWRGTTLAVRLIRLLSVLLGAGTVYFTCRLALELAPGQAWTALAAGAVAGFTPMFVFISASVNNDNLAVFLSAYVLWQLARWTRGPLPPLGWSHVLLGAALGGAALSKSSALGLMPLAGLVLLFGNLRRRLGARRLLLDLLAEGAVAFGVALAVAGWWYWRNFQLYGDWLGWNAFLEIVGRRPGPATLLQLWGERVGFMQAYWGLFGGVSVPMPGWTYALLNAALGLGLVGALAGAARALRQRRASVEDLAVWALGLAWLGLLVVGLIRWTSLTWASQGRLLFPALPFISALAALGLRQIWRGLPWALALGMAALAAAVPFTVIAPHYAAPPPLAPTDVVAIPRRLDADFGGEMTLLGYDLEADSVQPGGALRFTLYWQSQIAMDRNWSVFAHLVDDAGVIVGQRDRYPGAGALPTTLMTPGQTLADRYVLRLPETAYAPAPAQLLVGLYDAGTGERLPLAEGQDMLALSPVSLLARPGDFPNPVGQDFGGQIELAGYEMSARRLMPGDELSVSLYWRALKTPAANYSVFVHVRGQGQTLWARSDAWPQAGAAPTSTWWPGVVVTDVHTLRLEPDTPGGQLDVEIGLYALETLERLRLFAPEGYPTDADALFLSRIWVEADGP